MGNSMKYKTLFIVLAIACFFTFGLAAQNKNLNEDQNTRSVTGTVTDSGGAPVAGANVQRKDTKTLQIRSYGTHEEGAYHFAGLSTNVDYELKAEHEGHSSGTKNLSNFDGHKTAVVDLKL